MVALRLGLEFPEEKFHAFTWLQYSTASVRPPSELLTLSLSLTYT